MASSPSCNGGAGTAKGPCTTKNGAIGEGNAISACHSSFNGNGFVAPIIDPTCPASLPYRYVCASDQGGSDFCCTHAGADGGDPSCQVCPEHGCSTILGGNGSGVCFTDSTECQVDPNPSSNGAATKRCPMLVSMNTHLGNVCQTWCQANSEECSNAMNSYCARPGNTSLPACSCVAPWATQWGDLSFTSLQQIVRANPKIQKQLDAQAGQGETLNIGCAWPPCTTTDKGVMVPPNRTCPPIGNLCVNVIEDVHLSDVIAGTVTVGECSSGGGKGGSNSTVGGGMDALPFGTALQLWLVDNPMTIVVLVAVFVTIFGALAYLAFKPASALQLAEAEMTLASLQAKRQRKMNRLTSTMLASPNAQVVAAGRELLKKRQEAARLVRTRFHTAVQQARERIAGLKKFASGNSQAGEQTAALQAQIAQLQADQKEAVGAMLQGLPTSRKQHTN